MPVHAAKVALIVEAYIDNILNLQILLTFVAHPV